MPSHNDSQARIGASLRRFRAARELSQDELATQVGTSRSHISDLETDKAVPDLDEFVRLAAAVNVEPAAFFPRSARQAGAGWEVLAGRLQLTYDDAVTLRGLLEAAGEAETASAQDALLAWMTHRKVIP